MISLLVLCCFAALHVNAQEDLNIAIPISRPTDIVGKCPAGTRWTRFYSTDFPNPDDTETLNVFRQRYKICDPKRTIVTGVRARVVGLFFQPYWVPRNVLDLDLTGLRCIHNNQPYITDSTNPYTPSQRRCPCRNYEVSFCCPEHGIVGEPDNCEWGSNWLDRDNPSGTGDWELRSFHRCYCPRGDVPVAIQARILAPGTPLHLAPWTACNQVITISPSYGLVCRNEDQQNTNNVPECKDYEVRYCCPIRRVSSASTCSLVSQSARGRGPT